MSLGRLLCSSIGKKVIMAVTGLMIIGFVVAHLLGNLQVFLGQSAFNNYASFLKSLGAPLWAARLGLLFVILVHIITAIKLTQENSAARPNPYRFQNTRKASVASRYMFHSGMLIMIFIIFHLLHFTFGLFDPKSFNLHDASGRHDVYSMLVYGFQNKLYAFAYIGFMIAIGSHLSHAISSMVQTIGFNHSQLTPKIKVAGSTLAWIIAIGYISIPVSVMCGLVKLPDAQITVSAPSGGY